MLLNME